MSLRTDLDALIAAERMRILFFPDKCERAKKDILNKLEHILKENENAD